MTFVQFYIAWRKQRIRNGGSTAYQAAVLDWRLFKTLVDAHLAGNRWKAAMGPAWSDDLCYLFEFWRDHERAKEEANTWHGISPCYFCK